MNKPKQGKSDAPRAMKPGDFKRWRKTLGFNQKEAAEVLGLKRRVVQYYEKGERDGKKIDIPKYIRLACYAITKNVLDYSGPEDEDKKDDKKKPKTARTDKTARARTQAKPAPAKDAPKKRRAKANAKEAPSEAAAPQPDAPEAPKTPVPNSKATDTAPGTTGEGEKAKPVRAVALKAQPAAKTRPSKPVSA